jgi:hypothetical protein
MPLTTSRSGAVLEVISPVYSRGMRSPFRFGVRFTSEPIHPASGLPENAFDLFDGPIGLRHASAVVLVLMPMIDSIRTGFSEGTRSEDETEPGSLHLQSPYGKNSVR